MCTFRSSTVAEIRYDESRKGKDMYPIGTNIRQLREQNGMTQDELAAKTGEDRTTVSRWETGKSLPLPEQACRLSSVFHVTLDELITGEKTGSDEIRRPPVKTVDEIRQFNLWIRIIIVCIAAMILRPYGFFLLLYPWILTVRNRIPHSVLISELLVSLFCLGRLLVDVFDVTWAFLNILG